MTNALISSDTGRLTGIVPPVSTPLTEDGDVDVDSYRRVLDRLIDAGVDGLFVLGSTSEVVYLTDRQRRLVLQTAIEEARGRVPVLAGVIDMTAPRVFGHVKVAEELGADGVVVTAPFYTKIVEVEIENQYRIIHAATNLPVWAYDIPVCVGNKLSIPLVLRLARDGVIAGLKDSSGDDVNLRRLILEVRADRGLDGFSIFTGSELTVDSSLAFGVDGAVPGLGNVDPEGFVRLFAFARAGQWEKARAEQDRLIHLFDFVRVGSDSGRMGTSSSAMGAFKAALNILGVTATGVTAAPQIPLNEEERAAVRGFLERAGLLGAAVPADA